MHRAAFLLLLVWAGACAQTTPQFSPAEMPPGLFRGSFIRWSGSTNYGEFTIRTPQNNDLFCYFDSHTYMERDYHRIAIAALNAGEKVEILADHKPGSSTCYARTVAVIDLNAERVAAERARQAMAQPAAMRPLFFTPRGDRSVSGMVVGMTSWALTLKTAKGEKTLALRPDTAFLSDGVRADPGDLRINTRVFVRAGKTIEGAVEAYQVVWGGILDVR